MSSLRRLKNILAPTGLYSLAAGSLVAAELGAYCAAFDTLLGMLGDFIRDISPERAKEEALALCEAACGLPPRPGAPEKSRRELIALRQRPIGFCGKKELLAALEGCGLVSPELEEEGLAIRILAEGAREEADPGGVFILAKGLIPAHLSVKEGCEWDRLDRSKTPWEEADARAKSWDELKFTRLYSNCKK